MSDGSLDNQLQLFGEFMQFKKTLGRGKSSDKVVKPTKARAAAATAMTSTADDDIKPRYTKKDLKEKKRKINEQLKQMNAERKKKEYSDEEKAKNKQKMADLRARKQKLRESKKSTSNNTLV